MAHTTRIHSSRVQGCSARHRCVLALGFAIAASACGSEPSQAGSIPQPAEQTAKPQSPAGSAGPTTETPKPTAELIKCKDLLPKAQVAALGFDVSKYDDEAAQSRPDRGCMCSFGKLGQEHVNATLFPGHTYRVLTEEQKKSKPKDKLMAMVAPTYVDGPAVGAHSQWYERSNFKGLMFLGENKRYWVNIGSKDEETVMKVAKLLQANMSKR